MDGIRNIPELVLEFISRSDFIAIYVGLVGAWFLWFGIRGLRLGNTKGFGWRSADVSEEAAVQAGRAWLMLALGLVSSGVGLWLTT